MPHPVILSNADGVAKDPGQAEFWFNPQAFDDKVPHERLKAILMRQFYTYILASKTRVLYVGVTNNLVRRLWLHRQDESSFVSRYRVHRLVYFEVTHDVRAAIAREKQIKGWLRRKKKTLIESVNPDWLDLSEDWERSS